MGDFLKQFFEGLSCDSLAPVLFSKPISDLKFSFLGVARNMTTDLLSSKNRLIYVLSRIHDSLPMCVKGRSVLPISPHECSHAFSFRVELLLEENGNVGSLYVSNRNRDGIIHFTISAFSIGAPRAPAVAAAPCSTWSLQSRHRLVGLLPEEDHQSRPISPATQPANQTARKQSYPTPALHSPSQSVPV